MKIIECPRDAMQGIDDFIPTETKARYINQLLKVGFDTIDFGSFVSPKAIPQLRDTSEVFNMLDLDNTQSKLLAIIANKRGAEDACNFDEITYLGYPFSISETFQQRNTNASIEESLGRVEEIQNLATASGKQVVIYISMAFGNPYGDPWDPQIVIDWSERLHKELGINIISLADTVGVSNPESITHLFLALIPAIPEVEFGAHLHTQPQTWREKVVAAVDNGCMRFDGAIKGYGGCPMAEDELVGNMPTENLIAYLDETGANHGLDNDAFVSAMQASASVFA